MIKKKAEIKELVIPNFKGGDGHVCQFHYMNEQEAQGIAKVFGRIVIPPGSSVAPHTHVGDMEAYYVLKGQAILTDNGEEMVFEAGDAHICFDGDLHGLRNVSDEDFEYMAVVLNSEKKEV